MKLYLHIGLSKTGTSAIQDFLWNKRIFLLEKYKILYPTTGIYISHRTGAHYYLSWAINIPSEIKEKVKNISTLDEYLSSLVKEIQQNKLEKVVISSEYFMINQPDLVKKFFSNIASDLLIIVYIRRQDLWLESNFSQAFKIGDFKKTEFREFREKNKGNSRNNLYDYYNFICKWQSAFPEAQIIPRIYDRSFFPEGNVILDFLSILSIDIPEAKEYKVEANPSLSHLSTMVLRKINEKFDLTPEEHGKVVQYLFKLDKEEGSPIKTFFTLPERIEFLEHFRESNERLFREWFGTENKFVLSEEEIKFYEEQDRIPREEIEKMVEDRYRKVLAYMMEERVSPKGKLYPKVKIEYFPSEEVEFVRVDVLQADLLREGMINIGGLVLLKKEVEGEYKLFVKDNEGEKEVKWGLPSPGLESKYLDNPKAKNARFQMNGIKFSEKPLELWLNDKKLAEIKF